VSLKNISLRVRLIGGFLLMAAISAAIGIIGNINLRSMRQADLDLYQYDAEPQPDLAYISVTFQKIRVALRDFLAAPTPDQRANFLSQANDLGRDLDGAIERSGAGHFSHEERGSFDQFMQARGSYRDFEMHIVAAGKAGRPQDGWTILWSDSYGKVANSVLGTIAQIEQLKVANARKASEANLALASLSSAEMLIAIAFGLGLALGAGAWLTISITRPLNEAVLNLTGASQEILATTTAQASGAREQAAAVSQTATTADEITQTAQQAAERARNMGEAALRTAEIGGAGKKAVDGSIAAMHGVREQIESTAQNILALAE
jgi:methyl-accepting chemotaxis protein